MCIDLDNVLNIEDTFYMIMNDITMLAGNNNHWDLIKNIPNLNEQIKKIEEFITNKFQKIPSDFWKNQLRLIKVIDINF